MVRCLNEDSLVSDQVVGIRKPSKSQSIHTMITTFEQPHTSALGYVSTQTRGPSKSQVFFRGLRERLHNCFAFITCSRVVLAEVDNITSELNIIVEADVDDVAEVVSSVNEELAEMRRVATGGVDLAIRASEVESTRVESCRMLAEDRSVAVARVPFTRPRSEILDRWSDYMDVVNEVLPSLEEAGGPVAVEMYQRSMEEFWEETYGYTPTEMREMWREEQERVRGLYQPVILPDGEVRLLRGTEYALLQYPTRIGEDAVVPGWLPEQQLALENEVKSKLVPRVVFPRLVAACTLDARARWGLLPDTQANRLMVGHHMRKAVRNAGLRISAVDGNVALALNLFFIPHAGDLIARGQALHWSTDQRWYDYDAQGMSWWQRFLYVRGRHATPVV